MWINGGDQYLVRAGLRFEPDVEYVLSYRETTTEEAADGVVVAGVEVSAVTEIRERGDLWLDSDAPTGAAPTATATGNLYATPTELPAGSDWTPTPHVRRAQLAAPARSGGAALVTVSGNLDQHGAGGGTVVELQLTGAVGNLVRLTSSGPFVLTGLVMLAAGESAEVSVEHRYVSGSGADLADTALSVVFLPGAIAPGESSDPVLRYYDSGWQPPQLDAASIDVSEAVDDDA
jgi:hypothetical protein